MSDKWSKLYFKSSKMEEPLKFEWVFYKRISSKGPLCISCIKPSLQTRSLILDLCFLVSQCVNLNHTGTDPGAASRGAVWSLPVPGGGLCPPCPCQLILCALSFSLMELKLGTQKDAENMPFNLMYFTFYCLSSSVFKPLTCSVLAGWLGVGFVTCLPFRSTFWSGSIALRKDTANCPGEQ